MWRWFDSASLEARGWRYDDLRAAIPSPREGLIRSRGKSGSWKLRNSPIRHHFHGPFTIEVAPENPRGISLTFSSTE
jgi:hypothetical protein